MRFWINFWTFFFFLSIVLFSILAVVVTVGGFFNLRAMFKHLRSREAQKKLCDRGRETGG